MVWRLLRAWWCGWCLQSALEERLLTLDSVSLCSDHKTGKTPALHLGGVVVNKDRQDERIAPIIPIQEILRNVPKCLFKEQFKFFLAQTQKIPLCINLKWLFGDSVFSSEMVTLSPKKVNLGNSSIPVGTGKRLQLWDPVHFFPGILLSWNTSSASSGSWRLPARAAWVSLD